MTGRYAVAPAGALLLPPSARVSLRLTSFFEEGGLRAPRPSRPRRATAGSFPGLPSCRPARASRPLRGGRSPSPTPSACDGLPLLLRRFRWVAWRNPKPKGKDHSCLDRIPSSSMGIALTGSGFANFESGSWRRGALHRLSSSRSLRCATIAARRASAPARVATKRPRCLSLCGMQNEHGPQC
jgi:hypothetical protein